MIVTTPQRTATKLEAGVFQPAWLRAVLEDVETGFLVEAAEEIIYVNRAYAGLLGYDEPDSLLRRHLSLIVAEEDTHRLLEFGRRRQSFQAAPRHYDFTASCHDRSTVPLRAAVSTSTVEHRVLICTMVLPRPRVAHESDPNVAGLQRRPLSARETEVMERILAGQRIKEIAFALELSEKTVSTHRIRMLRKLNLTDNRDLFQYALRHHLIDWS